MKKVMTSINPPFITHETFDIMEDDEFYCKGIVFYKKDLGE